MYSYLLSNPQPVSISFMSVQHRQSSRTCSASHSDWEHPPSNNSTQQSVPSKCVYVCVDMGVSSHCSSDRVLSTGRCFPADWILSGATSPTCQQITSTWNPSKHPESAWLPPPACLSVSFAASTQSTSFISESRSNTSLHSGRLIKCCISKYQLLVALTSSSLSSMLCMWVVWSSGLLAMSSSSMIRLRVNSWVTNGCWRNKCQIVTMNTNRKVDWSQKTNILQLTAQSTLTGRIITIMVEI